METWRKVLWSDEATFTVTGCGHHRVYRRPDSDPLDPRYTVKTVKQPDSVMVWGAFSYYGVVELIVLEKSVKVDRIVYFTLLFDALHESLTKHRHYSLCKTVLLATLPRSARPSLPSRTSLSSLDLATLLTST